MGKEKSFFGKATNFAISVGSSVVNTASSAGTGAYNLAKSAIDTGKADIELWNKSKEQHKLNQERLEKIKGEYDVSYALLDEAALIAILTQPKNAIIKQYEELLNYDGVKLEVTKDALIAIARKAMARGTGARGLRGIIEEILNPIMFVAPDKAEKYVIVDANDGEITVEFRKTRRKKKREAV